MYNSRKPAKRPPITRDEQLAQALAAPYEEEAPEGDTPPPRGAPAASSGWYPDLNPTQKLIFEDSAQNVLGHGEKGSGKSLGFGHKLVRHAYENDNALVLVVSPSMRAVNEGIWHDLETLILPQWRDGIGLEYTIAKLDPNTKDRHRWIRNRHGGWSKLLMMSVPYAAQVKQRFYGPAPSMVYVDELTNCEGREYWTYPSAQLGRRRGIAGPQQFCASCNPAGPSHWVYQVFFVECVDHETGRHNPRFSVHHVPFSENEHRLPPGYKQQLMDSFKGDPTELQRMLNGEWVDRPTGDGLFKEFYIPALHLKGDFVKGIGLRPKAGYPIHIGYDLGQIWNSITFEQCVTTKNGPVWLIFDEVDHLGEKVLYKKMAWEVIDRMRFWKRQMEYDFKFQHVSDDSAVNQFRPGGDGSYDALDFEREFNKVAAEMGQKSIKILGCPKGDGSVAARIRLFQSKLYQEEVVMSAMCRNAVNMVLTLEADKENPEKPKRGKYLHKFDSMTYPMFKLELGGGTAASVGRVAPSLIRCGSR